MKNIFCLKLYHLLVISIVLLFVSCSGKNGTDASKVNLTTAPDSIGSPPPPVIKLSNSFYTLYTTTAAFYAIPNSINRMYFTYSFSSNGVPLLNGWSLKNNNQFDSNILLVQLSAAQGPPSITIPITNLTSFGNLSLDNKALKAIQGQNGISTYVIFTPVLIPAVSPNTLASVKYTITYSGSIPTSAPSAKRIAGGPPAPLQVDELNPSPPRDY